MFPLKVTLTTVSSGNNYTQPSPGALNLPRTVCWHMGYGFFHNTHLIYFDVFFHTECKVFFFSSPACVASWLMLWKHFSKPSARRFIYQHSRFSTPGSRISHFFFLARTAVRWGQNVRCVRRCLFHKLCSSVALTQVRALCQEEQQQRRHMVWNVFFAFWLILSASLCMRKCALQMDERLAN